MRKALGAFAFVAAMWAGSAQAAVKLILTADLTRTYSSYYEHPDPVTEHIGAVQMTIEAESWDADRFFFFGPVVACSIMQESNGTGCLQPTFSGNSLGLSAPGLEGWYQWMTIGLSFDKAIENSPHVFDPAAFEGGYFSWSYGHHYSSESLYGSIRWLAVPEPASWAMMIAGFGLIGGIMRRKPHAVFSI